MVPVFNTPLTKCLWGVSQLKKKTKTVNKCVIYEGVITKNVCEENKVIATCVTSVCVCAVSVINLNGQWVLTGVCSKLYLC